MSAILRKLAASVVLAFTDGTEAQTLVGTDFMLERAGDDFSLSIDLSSNLLPRNKGLLCYYEAQGLLLQHAQLRSLRIHEKDLVKTLGHELKPETPVKVILNVGEDKVFTYPATPVVSDRNITIVVQEAKQPSAA